MTDNTKKQPSDIAADYTLRLIVATRQRDAAGLAASIALLQAVPREVGLWALLTQAHSTFEALGREHYGRSWTEAKRDAVMAEVSREIGMWLKPTLSVIAMLLRACCAVNVLGERVYGDKWATLTADEAALAALDAELDRQ